MLATIVNTAQNPRNRQHSGLSQALQAVARCLPKHETVQSILAARCRNNSRTTTSRVCAHDFRESVRAKYIALPIGAPAEYFSHSDVINRRKQLNAAKEAKAAAKIEARRKQAEKRREREEEKKKRAISKAEAQEKKKREA